MSIWIIEKTRLFDEKFKKLIPDNLKEDVLRQVVKLGENPYNSKPLGYSFFREKKIKKWRIYFMVYESKLVIYFVDLSDKKLQQATINRIKDEFANLKKEIEVKFGPI